MANRRSSCLPNTASSLWLEVLPRLSNRRASPENRQPRPTPKKKLSYKDERRLTELNDLLPKTQKEISALEARLGDPDLYAKSPAEAAKLGQELDAKRTSLEELEMEWLELEEKREALA